MFEFQVSDENENIFTNASYEIYGTDKVYTIQLSYSGSDMDRYREIKESFKENVLSDLQIEGYTSEEREEEVISYNQTNEEDRDSEDTEEEDSSAEPEEDKKDESDKNREEEQDSPDSEESQPREIDLGNKGMYQNLKGKIVLKVEDDGKAYYVNPNDQKMNFLGKPKNAFELMRSQGVGISNENLSKIPVGLLEDPLGEDSDGDGLSDMLEDSLGTDKNSSDSDGDGYNDKEELEGNYSPVKKSAKIKIDSDFADKQKGKIFIQVEGQGEAWYVNPEDDKRYFLGRPANAFMVMRKLSLGISNQGYEDLREGKKEE
jgi:DNA mismatch repair ATPase MutL